MAKGDTMVHDDNLPTTREVEYRADGNAIMAVYKDFTNLAEDVAGFGATEAEAFADLMERTGGTPATTPNGTPVTATFGEPVAAGTTELTNLPEPVAPGQSVEAAIATDTREGRWRKLDPTRARPVATPETEPEAEPMANGTEVVTIERDGYRMDVSRLAYRDLYEPHGYSIVGDSE